MTIVADVLVLGAGKVGVKAAEAGAVRGRRVTLVEQARQPLIGALDEVGGTLVRRLLEQHGVTVRTGVTLTEVRERNGTGCEVPPGTPLENLQTLVRVAHEYRGSYLSEEEKQ